MFHVHVNVERELCLETTTYSWPQKQPLDKNTSQHKVHLCFKVRLWSFKHVLRPPDTMESICNRLLDLVLRIDGQFVSLFVQSDIKYFFPWCDDPIDFLFIFKVNDSRTLKISFLNVLSLLMLMLRMNLLILHIYIHKKKVCNTKLLLEQLF